MGREAQVRFIRGMKRVLEEREVEDALHIRGMKHVLEEREAEDAFHKEDETRSGGKRSGR